MNTILYHHLLTSMSSSVPEGEGPDGLGQVLLVRVHVGLVQSCKEIKIGYFSTLETQLNLGRAFT